MINMEAAICYMAEHTFAEYQEALQEFRNNCSDSRNLSHIRILREESVRAAGAYGCDATRLVFYTQEPGPKLLAMLADEGNIVCEMAGRKHVVLISTVRDSKCDFDLLYKTLQQSDILLNGAGNRTEAYHDDRYRDISGLVGTRAKAPIYVYPPGSYIVNTGELITGEIAEELRSYQAAGIHIRGI